MPIQIMIRRSELVLVERNGQRLGYDSEAIMLGDVGYGIESKVPRVIKGTI